MIIETAKWVVVLFGCFIISSGFLMLFKPTKARMIVSKAGSTNFINYTEITIRLCIAIAFIIAADLCKYPNTFAVFGWFMLVTSLILYMVPRKLHHNFSNKSATLLKPMYFRLISPFAFLLGGFIIYNLI